MSKITLYGIPNCDTVKKARRFLDKSQRKHEFHDLRKDGCDTAMVKKWLAAGASASLVNKRSTTWKSLDENDKAPIEKALASLSSAQQLKELSSADEKKLCNLLADNPTLIKRPVLSKGKTLLIGFSESDYQSII